MLCRELRVLTKHRVASESAVGGVIQTARTQLPFIETSSFADNEYARRSIPSDLMRTKEKQDTANRYRRPDRSVQKERV